MKRREEKRIRKGEGTEELERGKRNEQGYKIVKGGVRRRDEELRERRNEKLFR
jgi:hypothetical protein